MRAKLVSVAVALVALAAASPAYADSGGAGAVQAALQGAATGQAAAALATSRDWCGHLGRAYHRAQES